MPEVQRTDPGIRPTDIALNRLDNPEIGLALVNGAIDTGAVPGPFWQEVQDG